VNRRDVLSKWVEIIIPDSKKSGWVSVQTDYSKVIGDLSLLPDFTPTEWPLPAYIRNCTHHQMYILPGEIRLPSTYETPENEIWLYPGRYNVYDLDVSGEPEVLQVDMREGLALDIRVDGLETRYALTLWRDTIPPQLRYDRKTDLKSSLQMAWMADRPSLPRQWTTSASSTTYQNYRIMTD
jgi:hypothetical protein